MSNEPALKLTKSKDLSIDGTSLQGYLEMTYDQLVSIFGEPNSDGDGYKVDAEWDFKLNDEVITIYNYKNGKNYGGAGGIETKDIILWNVGGVNKQAYTILIDYLEGGYIARANNITSVFSNPVASFIHLRAPQTIKDVLFSTFFDVKSKEHLDALKIANTTHLWPKGFVPDNVIVDYSIGIANNMVIDSIIIPNADPISVVNKKVAEKSPK